MDESIKRRKHTVCFSLIVLVSVISGIIIFIFDENENNIHENIKNKFEHEIPIPLRSVFKKNTGVVCVIYPYGDKVINTNGGNEKEIKTINEYLRKIDFVADEGTWGLIVLIKNDIQLLKFDRNPDILSSLEVEALKKIRVPSGFMPQQCASIDFGYFVQTTIKDRKFVILGEMK